MEKEHSPGSRSSIMEWDHTPARLPVVRPTSSPPSAALHPKAQISQVLLWVVFRSCLSAGLSQSSREHNHGFLGQCNRRQPSLRHRDPSSAGAIQGEWVPCQLLKSGSSSGTPCETQDNLPGSCQPPLTPRAAQAPPGSPCPLPGAPLSAPGPVMLKLSQRFLCSSQTFLLPNTHGQTFQRIIGKTRTFPFARNCCSRAVLPRGGTAPGSPSVRGVTALGSQGEGQGT